MTPQEHKDLQEEMMKTGDILLLPTIATLTILSIIIFALYKLITWIF